MTIDPSQDSSKDLDLARPDVFTVDPAIGEAVPVVHPTIFEDDAIPGE